MPDTSSPRITVPCPECGREMVVRTNGTTGEQFFGCSQYPTCKGTRPIGEDVKMRLAGAVTLPGF